MVFSQFPCNSQELLPSLVGRWQYLQTPDTDGEVFDLAVSSGHWRGIMNGLERDVEDGPYYYVVEIENLAVSPDGKISFELGERKFFTKRPPLSQLGGEADGGFALPHMRFSGRIIGDYLVLQCKDEGGSCPGSSLQFKRLTSQLKPSPAFNRASPRSERSSKVNENNSPGKFKSHADTEVEIAELKQVTKISKAFAESHMLGTGSTQYLTRVKDISGDSATVFIGQRDEDRDDPELYKINLRKINSKWKVVTYEFGKIGSTGDIRRVIDRVDIHGSLFPSLELDQLIASNGGVGYFKQYPNELDKNEVPISLMRRSRFITVETINKHKTDGVVIGRIQRGKKPHTLVSIYGKSENDISKYIQELSSELPLIAVNDVKPFEACGKSIVKAELSIIAIQDQLSITENQNAITISFEMDGKKFDCNIQETN